MNERALPELKRRSKPSKKTPEKDSQKTSKSQRKMAVTHLGNQGGSSSRRAGLVGGSEVPARLTDLKVFEGISVAGVIECHLCVFPSDSSLSSLKVAVFETIRSHYVTFTTAYQYCLDLGPDLERALAHDTAPNGREEGEALLAINKVRGKDIHVADQRME